MAYRKTRKYYIAKCFIAACVVTMSALVADFDQIPSRGSERDCQKDDTSADIRFKREVVGGGKNKKSKPMVDAGQEEREKVKHEP